MFGVQGFWDCRAGGLGVEGAGVEGLGSRVKMLRAFRGSRVCRVAWFRGFRIPAMWADLGPGIISPTQIPL